MSTKESPEVKFMINRDGTVIDCIGRFERDHKGPYAEGCSEVSSGIPIAQTRVSLREEALRRGHCAQQSRDFCYHGGFVTLGQ